MGLDMYFEASKSKSNSYSRWDKEEKKSDNTNYPEELKVLADYIEDRNFKYAVITESYQIGYFRKFNALHSYIVKTYADGEDDCRRIYLNREAIQNLYDICSTINTNHSKASTLLPTQEGFFFGSTMYDDYYYSKVEDAVELFKLILDIIDFKEWEIVYQASW